MSTRPTAVVGPLREGVIYFGPWPRRTAYPYTPPANTLKLGAWFASQGKTDDVSRAYPVSLPPVGWTGSDLPAPHADEVA